MSHVELIHTHTHIHRLLEIAVEEMRVDVVERRCGVREEEVATLSQAVSTVTNAVTQLQGIHIAWLLTYM